MESVWDYPRPPRVEASTRRVRVEFAGEVIADTTRAYRVLETSHPPVYYIPPEDVRREFLRPSRRRTWCEFKGEASYYDLVAGGREVRDVAWYYPDPAPRLRGDPRPRRLLPRARRRRVRRRRAGRRRRPATSTAAGSPRTSRGRSRAGRARPAGSAAALAAAVRPFTRGPEPTAPGRRRVICPLSLRTEVRTSRAESRTRFGTEAGRARVLPACRRPGRRSRRRGATQPRPLRRPSAVGRRALSTR